MTGPRSFGMGAEPDTPDVLPDDPVPTPVLHVGEVHADLRLHITTETLTELGSQLASMIAQATQAGFEAGWTAATAEPEGDER